MTTSDINQTEPVEQVEDPHSARLRELELKLIETESRFLKSLHNWLKGRDASTAKGARAPTERERVADAQRRSALRNTMVMNLALSFFGPAGVATGASALSIIGLYIACETNNISKDLKLLQEQSFKHQSQTSYLLRQTELREILADHSGPASVRNSALMEYIQTRQMTGVSGELDLREANLAELKLDPDVLGGNKQDITLSGANVRGSILNKIHLVTDADNLDLRGAVLNESRISALSRLPYHDKADNLNFSGSRIYTTTIALNLRNANFNGALIDRYGTGRPTDEEAIPFWCEGCSFAGAEITTNRLQCTDCDFTGAKVTAQLFGTGMTCPDGERMLSAEGKSFHSPLPDLPCSEHMEPISLDDLYFTSALTTVGQHLSAQASAAKFAGIVAEIDIEPDGTIAPTIVVIQSSGSARIDAMIRSIGSDRVVLEPPPWNRAFRARIIMESSEMGELLITRVRLGSDLPGNARWPDWNAGFGQQRF